MGSRGSTESNASNRGSTCPPVPLARAIAATIVTLLVAAALEFLVYGRGGHDALGDLPGRYFAWHLHRADWPYVGHPIEYPVIIGYLAFATSWVGRSVRSFLLLNGLVSAVLALTMTILLTDRGGNRIWRWAAGVPLALYAFHNWDLVAMVPAVAALIEFDRGRDRSCGLLLALGAWAKVFPAYFLVPLAIVRWCNGDRRASARLVGAFLVTTAIVNLPVAWTSWRAWTHPIAFQGARAPTWGSLWVWTFRLPVLDALVGVDLTTAVGLLALLAAMTALVIVSVIAVRRRLDAFAIGAALTGAFVLANKVYSPNYDLWLVPFFVLLPVARRVWVVYCASDLTIFVLVFGFLHGNWTARIVQDLLPALVVIRAGAIVAVIFTALQVARSPTRRHTPAAMTIASVAKPARRPTRTP